MIYRDEWLFDRVDRQQHTFTCEPFQNLVQHNVIIDDGVSFDIRRDQGRIYRVVPSGVRNSAQLMRLPDLTTQELVTVLESSNGWRRDAAQPKRDGLAGLACLSNSAVSTGGGVR